MFYSVFPTMQPEYGDQQMGQRPPRLSEYALIPEYDEEQNIFVKLCPWISKDVLLRKQAPKQEELTMFGEVKKDVTTFIKEYRGVIYFIALFLLVDHFIFKGVFKERLQKMAESLITKVEAKVSAS